MSRGEKECQEVSQNLRTVGVSGSVEECQYMAIIVGKFEGVSKPVYSGFERLC